MCRGLLRKEYLVQIEREVNRMNRHLRSMNNHNPTTKYWGPMTPDQYVNGLTKV